MQPVKYTRRRSPSLTVCEKETERAPPTSAAAHHRRPWNKYGVRVEVPPVKLGVELSQPSRDEFKRIRNWATEKRKFEERQAELERQRQSLREQRRMASLEATRSKHHTEVVQEVERRQEKRAAMQREREEAQKRYLAFRQCARLTPLLHELRHNEFEQALKRSESARMELYNAHVKPFRTMRPQQIVSTSILKDLGKMREVDEREVPFELKTKSLTRLRTQVRSKSLPPPSLPNSDPPLKSVQNATPSQSAAPSNVEAAAVKRVDSAARSEDAITQTENEAPKPVALETSTESPPSEPTPLTAEVLTVETAPAPDLATQELIPEEPTDSAATREDESAPGEEAENEESGSGEETDADA